MAHYGAMTTNQTQTTKAEFRRHLNEAGALTVAQLWAEAGITLCEDFDEFRKITNAMIADGELECRAGRGGQERQNDISNGGYLTYIGAI